MNFQITKKLAIFGVCRPIDEVLDEIRRQDLSTVRTGEFLDTHIIDLTKTAVTYSLM